MVALTQDADALPAGEDAPKGAAPDTAEDGFLDEAEDTVDWGAATTLGGPPAELSKANGGSRPFSPGSSLLASLTAKMGFSKPRLLSSAAS
jgi:hypothetical protein